MTVIVKSGQNFMDIAIEQYGDAQFAFTIANSNSLAVTDDLVAGDVLTLPTIEITTAQKKIKQYFLTREAKPASELPL